MLGFSEGLRGVIRGVREKNGCCCELRYGKLERKGGGEEDDFDGIFGFGCFRFGYFVVEIGDDSR